MTHDIRPRGKRPRVVDQEIEKAWKPRPAWPTRGDQKNLSSVLYDFGENTRNQIERRKGVRPEVPPTDRERIESEGVRVPGLGTVQRKTMVDLVGEQIEIERTPSLYKLLEERLMESPFRWKGSAPGQEVCDEIFLTGKVRGRRENIPRQAPFPKPDR